MSIWKMLRKIGLKQRLILSRKSPLHHSRSHLVGKFYLDYRKAFIAS